MQDVTIIFVDGPLRGRRYEFEVGSVEIGRLPDEGGLELKGADTSVSRVHALLVEEDGDIELRNRSPNGTKVDGKLVLDSVILAPGARVEIGERHPFEVQWVSLRQKIAPESATTRASRPVLKQGPLSSPIVRAVIGIYLLGIVALAVWLGTVDEGGTIAADDWPALESAYASWEGGSVTAERRGTNLERAKLLVRELRVLRTRGTSRDVELICREIMSLDKSIDSPLFQYGARCLAGQ